MSDRFLPCIVLPTVLLCFLPSAGNAQKRRLPVRASLPKIQKQSGNSSTAKYRKPVPAVVIEEKLAILRFEPSLAAIPIQRLRTGRALLITGERQTDGITFFRVKLPPEKSGWVQAEAIASNTKQDDDERLAALIRVADGFDKLELATVFLENFPKSAFRPAILLLAGDLAEEASEKLSLSASRKLSANEIQASGAPLRSFYLSFNELDRYRKIGVGFVFNQTTKRFHYDGSAWREILQKYSDSAETAEARKRLDSLILQTK